MIKSTSVAADEADSIAPLQKETTSHKRKSSHRVWSSSFLRLLVFIVLSFLLSSTSMFWYKARREAQPLTVNNKRTDTNVTSEAEVRFSDKNASITFPLPTTSARVSITMNATSEAEILSADNKELITTTLPTVSPTISITSAPTLPTSLPTSSPTAATHTFWLENEIIDIPGINETVWPVELRKPQSPLFLYLEGSNQRMVGLGHSWMSFNSLVNLAVNNALTLRSSYYTYGHGINANPCQVYMFGDLFMAPLVNGTTCNRTSVKTPNDLAQQVQRVRQTMPLAGGCEVFVVKQDTPPSEKGLDRSLPNYRRLFGFNEKGRRTVIQRRSVALIPNGISPVHVSVHIRRGDLFQYIASKREPRDKLWQTEARLVPLSGYLEVMKQVLSKLKKDYGIHRVHFTFFCEGGFSPPASVMDANESYVDLRHALGGFVDAIAAQNVTFEGGDEKDALQAFDDMCFSDVLITGASGFSHLVSQLCSKPLVLATPFWHSYDYIPNAILLEVEKGPYELPKLKFWANLTTGMHFDEDRFDELWQRKR